MSQIVNYIVPGEEKLHCASCEQRVDRALRRVPGVLGVHASHRTQHIRVTTDPIQIDAAQVSEALRQVGFEVVPIGGAT